MRRGHRAAKPRRGERVADRPSFEHELEATKVVEVASRSARPITTDRSRYESDAEHPSDAKNIYRRSADVNKRPVSTETIGPV